MKAQEMKETNGGIICILILGLAWGLYNGYKEAEAAAGKTA